jgi:hypothetical protein
VEVEKGEEGDSSRETKSEIASQSLRRVIKLDLAGGHLSFQAKGGKLRVEETVFLSWSYQCPVKSTISKSQRKL